MMREVTFFIVYYAPWMLLFLPLPLIVLSSSCRLAVRQEEPLALRQLLWLDDELFVGVRSGLLPTSSTLLLLHPAQDATDTLAVRSATYVFWKLFYLAELLFSCVQFAQVNHSSAKFETRSQLFVFMLQVWGRSGRCCGQYGSLLPDWHCGTTAGGWTDKETALWSVINTLLLLLNYVFFI